MSPWPKSNVAKLILVCALSVAYVLVVLVRFSIGLPVLMFSWASVPLPHAKKKTNLAELMLAKSVSDNGQRKIKILNYHFHPLNAFRSLTID